MPKKEQDLNAAAGPPTFVYKTKGDYKNLVPVILSDDKTSIVSYPHPSDLKTANGISTPTELSKGYLLDNRGVGKNVAFVNITYEDYAKLESAPSLDQLFTKIIDKDPIVSLCNCGNRNSYKDVVSELNEVIDGGLLEKKCVVVK
jgi:hypothetical protein